MLTKQAQANPDDTSDEATKAPPAFLTHKAKRELIAYPDYGRSLVSQRWQDPAATGRKFAVGSGAMGAALGMLLARLAKNDPKLVAAGGVAGGIGGALLGNEAGKASANSENSRTFWMRRKPGINDPGEYESALRYGGRPAESIKPREKKAAAVDTVAKGIAKVLGKDRAIKWLSAVEQHAPALSKDVATGLGGVAAADYLVNKGNYADDPSASMLTRLAVPAAAMIMRRKPAHATYGIPALIWEQNQAANLQATHKATEAAKATAASQNAMATAIKGQAETANNQVAATKDVAKGSLGQVLKDTLSSNAALGTYGGLAAAGLGGLATGLTRAKSDEEIQHGTSRGKMVAKDFLRYAIPLGLAGGVGGSLIKAKPGPAPVK